MSWEVRINLGSRSRPRSEVITVEPLPSGMPSVLVAVRPSKAPSVRRRLERLFQRRGGRVNGATVWVPAPSRRAVAWQTMAGPRGAEWWVCGPLSWGGPQYTDVIETITRRDGWRAARLLTRRQLVIVDARTGAEVGVTAPPRPAPLDEDDDDDNAIAPDATRAA